MTTGGDDVPSDPRTATASAARLKRGLMSDEGDKRLLVELAPNETVEYFLSASTNYALITDRRVLCLVGAFHMRFVTAQRPVILKYGTKVPFVGQEVEVIGVTGTSFKVHAKTSDLAALERATRPRDTATTDGTESAPDDAGFQNNGTEFVGTWQAAESHAVEHLKGLGFLDAHLTQPGADGGLDALSSKAAAQVKHLSAPVGRPDLQKLVGAAQGRPVRVFYSSSGYSAAATTYANATGIALFYIVTGGVMASINQVARDLEQHSRAKSDNPASEYFQGRRQRKDAELAPRIDFLMGCVGDLRTQCELLLGHPKRRIRSKAIADRTGCDSMLIDLHKARSSDRPIMERKAILRRVARQLKTIAARGGRTYF